MKKLTALLLALVMALSLTACSFVMLPEEQDPPADPKQEQLAQGGTYTTKEDVALYIHLYGRLPDNFITKKEAQQLGWTGGSLEPYAPAAASAAAGSATMRACCRRPTAAPGPSATSTPWGPIPGELSASCFPTTA